MPTFFAAHYHLNLEMCVLQNNFANQPLFYNGIHLFLGEANPLKFVCIFSNQLEIFFLAKTFNKWNAKSFPFEASVKFQLLKTYLKTRLFKFFIANKEIN